MGRLSKEQIRILAEGELSNNKKKLLRQIEEKRYAEHRKRYLPRQIRDTRKKLELLIEEAKRLDMKHLLTIKELNNL